MGGFFDSLTFNGHMLPVLILTAPFISPIPIPILSSSSGFLTVIIGGAIMLGFKPWIPERIYKLSVSKGLITRLLTKLAALAHFLEKFSKPRLKVISQHSLSYRFNGLLILLCGIVYLLPLPPFLHIPAATTVGVLACGNLEDDGLFILIGYLCFILNLAMLVLLVLFGAELLEWATG